MKLSVLQMCSSATPEKNLGDIINGFEIAHKENSQLILLPENCLNMAARLDDIKKIDWNDYVRTLQSLCQKYTIACVCGTIPLQSQTNKNKHLAASIFINNQGEVKAQYNKIHLFDVDVGDEKGMYRESDEYDAGTEPVMFELNNIKFGMSVCFDLRFSGLFQYYQRLGANVILVPSAFTHKTGKLHWEVLLRARAIETQCYIVAANQYGEHDDGRRTWGHSMIVDPNGDIISRIEDGFGVKTIPLDIEYQHRIRRLMPLKPKNFMAS